MLQKAKTFMLGLSVALAAVAGAAHATTPDSFYNPNEDYTGPYYYNDCAPAEFYGYRYPNGYTTYAVDYINDGQTLTVSGRNFNGVVVAWATFACVQGYLYYVDGPEYEVSNWWAN